MLIFKLLSSCCLSLFNNNSVIIINRGEFDYYELNRYYNILGGYAELKWITDLYFLSLYKPISDFDRNFKLLSEISRNTNLFDPNLNIRPYLLVYKTFFYYIPS